MSEEQTMILRMVSEGKITPDEGVELLDAIESGREERPRRRKRRNWHGPHTHTGHPWKGRGWRGPYVHTRDPYRADSDASTRRVVVSEGSRLVVTSHVGSLVVTGSDDPDVRIAGVPRRSYRLTQDDRGVSVSATHPTGPLHIRVPREITELFLKSHVGEVTARNLSNGLRHCEIRTHTGQIQVDTETLLYGRYHIKSHVGQINVRLPAASACHIRARCHIGLLNTDLPLDLAANDQRHLDGTLNDGGAEMTIQSHAGRIFVGEKKI